MKIYVSLLILACLASTIYGKAVPKSIAVLTKGLHEQCVDKTKVAEDLIEKGGAGEFSDQTEFKCYLNCLLETTNLISKSGVIDFDGFINIMPREYKEIGTKMVNDCRETTGTDNCERVYNFNVCLYKSNPAEYFIV